jgi:ankyrin repeat protein
MNIRRISVLLLAMLMPLVVVGLTATTKIQQKRRPKPNTPTKQSALFAAIDNRDAAKVKALIAAGADVNSRDKDDETALMRAVCGAVPEIIKSLLAAGAEVDARNQYGNTALIEATNCAYGDEAVRLLLDAGAKVDARNKFGRTALFEAAAIGSDKAVQALIDARADVNAKDETGRTPLMGAADQGREGHVKTLLAAGADVNAKDNRGMTALMLAEKSELAKYGDMVKLLKAAGAVEPTNPLSLCKSDGEALAVIAVDSDDEIYVCRNRVAVSEVASEVDRFLHDVPKERRVASITVLGPEVKYSTIVRIVDEIIALGCDRIGLDGGADQKKPMTSLRSARPIQSGQKDQGESSSPRAMNSAEPPVVLVGESAEGTVVATVGGIRVPLDDLASKVRALLKDRADKTVKIVAPGMIHYGAIDQVIDELKSGGADPIMLGLKSP